ncbi:MAG: site-specific integrase [Bacteroidetes bacterium]|nr:site-specific integrase [Bacteroidota bacterium]
MATVNFYLKEPTSKGDTLIYLIFHFKGNRLKFSTGETIRPVNWNSKRHRVKSPVAGSEAFNNYLNKLEEDVNTIYRTLKLNGQIPSSELIRQQLSELHHSNPKERESVIEVFERFIEINNSRWQKNTTKKYVTLLNHLIDFQSRKKRKITFESINLNFFEVFLNYYINDLKHLNSSIAKDIARLKTFLRWAIDHDYNIKQDFTRFRVASYETDIIYLSEDELFKLFEFNLTESKRLEQVRDVFCFGCFTGQRFSDIYNLKKDDIKANSWSLHTQKTKESISIPLNDFAIEILKKYDYCLPVISNQKTNKYLKELGRKVGINESITLVKYSGAERIEFIKPKYDFISTHTARRTFVTLSLEKGMRPETVMAITGHKDYKVFKKYIKITNKVKETEMKQIWNKIPSLKVV